MLTPNNFRDYQRAGIEIFLKKKRVGLFLPMGMGKTIITLSAIQYLSDSFMVSRTLIVTTKRIAQTVYTEELNEWSHLKYLTHSIAVGTPKQRKIAVESDSDLLIINFDNIRWLYENYPNLRFNCLIVDESTGVKNSQSQRFKYLRKYLHQVKYSAILTGTPSPHSYTDLWSQVFLLDEGQRLGKNITTFRRRYCQKGFFDNWEMRPSAIEEINKLVGDICFSFDPEKYLDLPPMLYQTVKGSLPTKLYGDYRTLEKEFILEFGTGGGDLDIVAVNKAVLNSKLLQFCSGAIYNELRETQFIHNIKMDMLKEIIEQNQGQQFIIAYTFKHEKERLLATFKNAELMDKDSKNVKRWNDGEIDLLLLHPASASHGLNLQKNPTGNTIIWFGYTNNLEHYLQLNKRIHRGEKKETCRVIHLALGDVEAKLMENLSRKDKTQQRLMKHLQG